jgi:hypothetical protein
MAESVSKEHYPKVDLGDLKMKERQKTLHIMQLFGHKIIRNTFMYTQLVDFKEDDCITSITHSEQETCPLIKAGFEFVCDFGNNKVFRKRK